MAKRRTFRWIVDSFEHREVGFLFEKTAVSREAFSQRRSCEQVGSMMVGFARNLKV